MCPAKAGRFETCAYRERGAYGGGPPPSPLLKEGVYAIVHTAPLDTRLRVLAWLFAFGGCELFAEIGYAFLNPVGV